MLDKNMIQEILDLKALGLSLNEVMERLESRPGKTPSLPTVRQYYRMDSIPDDFGGKLKKEMVFDVEPFRGAIIEIFEKNNNCCMSSVYDVLEERFIENGPYESLPGNEKTLRNFVHHLKETGAVDTGGTKRRTYDYVDATPPGEQMLVDFGQQRCNDGLVVHFICLLLRFSRLLVVFAQDHRFNAEEACRAIYRAFVKTGGRPRELVIDQDAVFVATETYGEVIETRVFGDFIKEQDLRLWVCNKADPESKGPVENAVGFVKKNYFSARDISAIEQVTRTMPSWLERKNKRIHQATFLVPATVFSMIEKQALSSLLPSIHEVSPVNLIAQDIGSTPYILYKSSRYSLPREMCYTQAFYKVIGEKLYVYDATRKHVCTHEIDPNKGSVKRLPEHVAEPSIEWMVVAEQLRDKYNCLDFQHFINGFKKENGRHLAKQLLAVEAFLDSERPSRLLVADVMKVCCEKWRYRFTQFQAVYELCKAKYATPVAVEMSDVEKRSLEQYQLIFEQRCAG